jgi:transposase
MAEQHNLHSNIIPTEIFSTRRVRWMQDRPFRALGLAVTRTDIEGGPLSQSLYAAMRDAGLVVELLKTRYVRDAIKAMPVKIDRKDARGIAQLIRLDWFRPVPCKSLPVQETRALLTALKLLQAKNHDGGLPAPCTKANA